jgi:hypothetical protein
VPRALTFILCLALGDPRFSGRLTSPLAATDTSFATAPVARSTEAYSFTSDSDVWSNRPELGIVTRQSVARWPVLAEGSWSTRSTRPLGRGYTTKVLWRNVGSCVDTENELRQRDAVAV